jgi:HEAT repeat protein
VASAAGDRDLAQILAQGNQALPGLKSAYARATEPIARLKYAHILALLGDSSGAEDLAAAVATATDWDAGWDFRAMGQFGSDMSRLDCTVVALGRTRHPAALEPILRLAAKLGSSQDFSHHRATALALEALGDPRAAPVLAAALRRPGMGAHVLASPADAIVAHTQTDPSLTALAPRRNALREIYLARALYRCGDHEDLGEDTLRAYLNDIRGHFARHAKAVLDQGTRSPR